MLKHRTTNRFDVNPFHEPDSSQSIVGINRLITAADLSIVFQPILRVATKKVFAYEALVRCRVPDFRNPMVLFERAAHEGCVGRLGRMIREIAVPLSEGVPLFVNIHPIELEERWFVRPDDPIYAHDREVYVEITEAVPMTSFDLCRSVLTEARGRGSIHLVVDDLGSGYSNLKYIADLEPRVVKLDRALVAGAKVGSRAAQLMAGIVSLCRGLKADVVAEGIETEEEFAVAKAAGVEFVQGYLFARPEFPLPLRGDVE